MNRLLALACAGMAFAASGADLAPEHPSIDVTLVAGKLHEACVKLEAGEKRRYHWKSSAPVDFNIHYHEGPEVFYPVKRDGMRGDGGTFTAKVAQDYCWTWTARKADVRVTGGITK